MEIYTLSEYLDELKKNSHSYINDLPKESLKIIVLYKRDFYCDSRDCICDSYCGLDCYCDPNCRWNHGNKNLF